MSQKYCILNLLNIEDSNVKLTKIFYKAALQNRLKILLKIVVLF